MMGVLSALHLHIIEITCLPYRSLYFSIGQMNRVFGWTEIFTIHAENTVMLKYCEREILLQLKK